MQLDEAILQSPTFEVDIIIAVQTFDDPIYSDEELDAFEHLTHRSTDPTSEHWWDIAKARQAIRRKAMQILMLRADLTDLRQAYVRLDAPTWGLTLSIAAA